ncbi:SPOR domain-containing protein [Nitrospirillum sp. BR 11752]|uniref:SPOR domain-containing protein n=1 Tax=Nitrospirillum sp. BR 11752 TaxID=3104293 RepID=UPI002EB2570C|nr:SPOR domain-containing protein [Nitrospirillum sp. BR 11752]
MAVGSFGGLIYFVYTQGQRAGTEAVAPIIHADPGPTKVKPETPGGMDVPNQDRLIYDRLRADKTDPGVERLLPPPEAPMERPTAPPPSQPAPQQAAAAPAQTPAPAVTPPPATASVPPTVLPPTAAGTKPAAPQQTAQAPASTPSTTPPATPPSANAPTPLVPQPQPAAPKPVVAAPPAPTPKPVEKPVAPPVPAPAASGGGTIKLQFASIPSEPQAEAEMQRIQRKHAAVLGGLSLRLVKADLGAKGIYYRVQSGPVDEAQAKRICEAVKAAKDGCIPVH